LWSILIVSVKKNYYYMWWCWTENESLVCHISELLQIADST